MKKVLALFLTLMMVFSLVACGGSDDTSANDESLSSIVEEEPDTVEFEGDADIKYADLIPDPNVIFAGASLTVTDPDGGSAYIFEVTNYNDDEFILYVAECKALGFDDISYESDTDFGAYTSDGLYWVQVNLDSDKEIIYVICQKSKNNN